jgi:hypothetical protein
MVQANVDKIIDFVKTKKQVSLPEISKSLGIPKEDVQKSLGYLEEDGVLKIDYKFTTPFVTFLKEPFSHPDVPSMKLEEPKMPQPPSLNGNGLQPPMPGFSLNEPNALNAPPRLQAPNPFEFQPEQSTQPTLLQMPPEVKEEIKESKLLITDMNPLEVNPSFDLNAPLPEHVDDKPISISSMKPVLGYNDEYKELSEAKYPEYVSSDLDKLDFMIDEANKKIVNYQYKGLNVVYREIYNFYRDAELSPNERYLMGNKVNELFQRMKRIYLLEKTV